eukprot:Nitzschia sp. Nitz4//scaffold1_size375055//107451//109246//NITZ4_000242-RA/size375055-snap-gene-0.192-mRNA-1//1//CDS//3329540943//8664//frame0
MAETTTKSIQSKTEKGNDLLWIGAGIVTAATITGFAFWLPFVLSPEAAGKTYIWASYSYDEHLSRFDNTVWTYGTDYGLGVIMTIIAVSILGYWKNGVSDVLCFRAAGLLVGYAVSVAFGGYCHQTYTTLESRNSMSFRILWTICVGSVTAASCFMGTSATHVIRQFQKDPNCSQYLKQVPILAELFWWTYGVCITIVCAAGGMSCQRPACDIFIAGITQAPPTAYIVAYLLAVQHPKVELGVRILGCFGFLLNIPLLPMYPILVQYTDWSLGSVNVLLHSWLCLAWSSQGLSLRRLIQITNAIHAEKTQVQCEVVTLNDDSFEHLTQASTGATTGSWLLVFGSENCASCQTLKPMVEELGQDEALFESSIVVGVIEANESPKVSQRFGIKKLPTVLYMHRGQMYAFPSDVERTTESLKEFVLEHYSKSPANPIPPPPTMFDDIKGVMDKLNEGGLLPIAFGGLAVLFLGTVGLLVLTLMSGGKAKQS